MPEENDIYLYTYDQDGNESPFDDWLIHLDKRERAIIHARITRVWAGNMGDCKPIKTSIGGIYELRIDKGPGYRIYFGKEGKKIIILLCGGIKGSQDRDIAKAVKHWKDYKSSSGTKKGVYLW